MELLLIFVGGLLGSSHCLGMCGGFVLAVGAGAANLRANFARQLTYGVGRIFSYTIGGGAAGFGGWRVARSFSPLIHAQAWLCLAAGVLLVAQGLSSAGTLPHWRAKDRAPCLAPALFAGFLSGRGGPRWFLAGMFNGLLPCGLVYAYLALATSTGNMLSGMIQMALFGLGTLPLMIASGCGASLLSLAGRRRLLRFAAWCVVVTGVLSIGRGYTFLVQPSGACPACSEP